MVGCMEVFGGVLVLGRVAAADLPTFEAEAQMHPGIAHFQTLLTPISAGRDVSYRVKMCTLFCHMFLPTIHSLIGWFLTLDQEQGTECGGKGQPSTCKRGGAKARHERFIDCLLQQHILLACYPTGD
jgi:hypothetical protein